MSVKGKSFWITRVLFGAARFFLYLYLICKILSKDDRITRWVLIFISFPLWLKYNPCSKGMAGLKSLEAWVVSKKKQVRSNKDTSKWRMFKKIVLNCFNFCLNVFSQWLGDSLFYNSNSILILWFICRFYSKSAVRKKTRYGRTDGPTDGPTDGRTDPHIEMRGRI